MMSCLRPEMADVMQFDEMQSRSYLGSYLDFLHGLQRMNRECDEMEPLEQSKCAQRQMFIAFSKDLENKNCDKTKPKFRQRALTTEGSDDAVIQDLEKLCRAAMAADSGEEKEAKKSMREVMEKIKPKVKDLGVKAIDKLIAENFYLGKILDFFGVNTSDTSDHALSMVGEAVWNSCAKSSKAQFRGRT